MKEKFGALLLSWPIYSVRVQQTLVTQRKDQSSKMRSTLVTILGNYNILANRVNASGGYGDDKNYIEKLT